MKANRRFVNFGMKSLRTSRAPLGNTLDLSALGSSEYAVLELDVPLILVMGPEKCGAVEAAVAIVTENAEFPGSIEALVVHDKSGELLDNTVRENVRRIVTSRFRTPT